MKSYLLSFLLILPVLSWGAPVIDITQIAGKTKEEVAAVLGAPDSVSAAKGGEKAHYAKGDTEIVFVRGKADWITVSALSAVPFTPKAIAALGLKETPPSFANSHVLRWKTLPGLLEVAIFPGKTNCDYAYIEVLTRPQ